MLKKLYPYGITKYEWTQVGHVIVYDDNGGCISYRYTAKNSVITECEDPAFIGTKIGE